MSNNTNARELALPESQYNDILERISSVCAVADRAERAAEITVLQKYHDIGALFVEFASSSTTGRYGARTVHTLAEDIVSRKLLPNVLDVPRFLYWSKNLYDRFPNFKELEDLGNKGFTLSHAKYMFSLSTEVWDTVSAQMITDSGRVVAVRGLRELIEAASPAIAQQRSSEALSSLEDSLEAPKPVETPRTAEESQTREAVVDDDRVPSSVPSVKGVKSTKDKHMEPISVTDVSTADVDPKRVFGSIRKNLTNLHNLMADAILAIKGSQLTSQSDHDWDAMKEIAIDIHSLSRGLTEPLKQVIGILETEFGLSVQ